MWWAQTGYKIAYAGIVGVWAVLMVMVFTSSENVGWIPYAYRKEVG